MCFFFILLRELDTHSQMHIYRTFLTRYTVRKIDKILLSFYDSQSVIKPSFMQLQYQYTTLTQNSLKCECIMTTVDFCPLMST